MKPIRLALGAMLSCAIAAPTGAQVHQVAFEWDADDGGHPNLDTSVAASPNRVLVATNQQIALLTRSGVEKDLIEWGDTDTIFQSDWFLDPRVDYDPYSGRLWIVVLGEHKIHVAVAKGATPDTLTPNDWHVYTGDDAFDLSQIVQGTPYQGARIIRRSASMRTTCGSRLSTSQAARGARESLPSPRRTTAARSRSSTEMSGDGVVDEEDMALYLKYYAEEDPRADMDRSGTITTADYLKYSDEYAKR